MTGRARDAGPGPFERAALAAGAGDTSGRDQHGRLPALPAIPRTVDHADEVIDRLTDEIRWLRTVIERLLTDLEVSKASATGPVGPARKGQRAVRLARPPSGEQPQ